MTNNPNRHDDDAEVVDGDLSESIAGIINADKRLTENFIAHVTHEVDRRSKDREQDRVKQWRTVATFIGAVIVASLTAIVVLSQYWVDSIVDEKYESVTLQMEWFGDYQLIQELAQKVDTGTSFGRSDRDQIMSLLQRAAESSEIRERSDFPIIVRKVVESFAAAGCVNNNETNIASS